jgi:hypothetical protein
LFPQAVVGYTPRPAGPIFDGPEPDQEEFVENVQGRSVLEWQADPRRPVVVRSARPLLRRSAMIQAAVMAAVGAGLYFLLGHHFVARIVWGLGGLFLLLGLLLPAAYLPVHRFGRWLGRVVGVLLVYLLLVPFFLLFFFPVSLILRLQGRDPMSRRMRPAGLTYWLPRLRHSDASHYERQFLPEDKQGRRMERPVGTLPAEAAPGGGESGVDR